MTEEEAKTKWCPMVRDVRMTNGNLEIGSGYCKASGCMMWRRTVRLPNDTLVPVSVKLHDDGSFTTEHPTVEREGYCGMGGKP